jgi:hypothetical protein
LKGQGLGMGAKLGDTGARRGLGRRVLWGTF